MANSTANRTANNNCIFTVNKSFYMGYCPGQRPQYSFKDKCHVWHLGHIFSNLDNSYFFY